MSLVAGGLRAARDRVGAEPAPGGKQRLVRLIAVFGDPGIEHGAGGFHGPVLAAFAEAAYVSTGAETDIRAVESRDLGYT